MRSKEVDLSEIKRYVEIFKEKAKKYDESVEIKGVSVGEEMRILDAVLAYIEELEQENKKYKNFQVHIYGMRSGKELLTRYINDSVLKDEIRDKIKLYKLEIETLKTLYPKTYTDNSGYYAIKIQALKEIIGE